MLQMINELSFLYREKKSQNKILKCLTFYCKVKLINIVKANIISSLHHLGCWDLLIKLNIIKVDYFWIKN